MSVLEMLVDGEGTGSNYGYVANIKHDRQGNAATAAPQAATPTNSI
jgi:hypothetical protein